MTEPEGGWRGDREFGTIATLLRLAARAFRGRVAIEDGDVLIRYGELCQRVARVARGLGVRRGDRVAIWAPNSWQWIVAALAAHTAGATLLPINTRFRGDEAAHVLVRSRARLLFTVRDFLGINYRALLDGADLPDLEGVIDLTALPEGDHPLPEVSPGDDCDLMFTSGTTGRPKAVPATHAQTLRAFFDWSRIVGLREDDRYLVVAPFFHSFGYKAGWLAALMSGATVLPQPVFDVGEVVARIARDRVTVLPGPPTLYQSLLAQPERPRGLRLAVTGAASVPVKLVHRMRDQLGFETVLTGYGLTEATGVSTLCRVGDDAQTVATTSGRAIPGVELRTAADGEILVRGYSVARDFSDREGWLHTGDIGALDARGYLRITDRKKDMFIVGGFNAYPAEIERVLSAHDAIAQVAVVGMPDERLGEVGLAFVVARRGATVAELDLISWSRHRMANYKVPRRVVLVDALPLNASGKVAKDELRRRARELT